VPILRFLWFYAIGEGGGHVQSLVLGGALIVIAVLTFLFGLIADLIGFNRQLLETTLEKVRTLELKLDRIEQQNSGGRAEPAPTIKTGDSSRSVR